MSRFSRRYSIASPEMQEHMLEAPCYWAELGCIEKLKRLLTDVGFVEAKCAAGRTYELQEDYDRSLRLCDHHGIEPISSEEIEKRWSQYIKELIEYARHINGSNNPAGKQKSDIEEPSVNVKVPELPPSLCSRENKSNILSDISTSAEAPDDQTIYQYADFVKRNLHTLAPYSHHVSFTAQQVYDLHQNDCLGKAAKARLEEIDEPYITRVSSTNSDHHPHRRGLRTMNVRVGEARCLVMTPDGRYALSGGDSRILCGWDLQEGRRLFELSGHPDRIFCVAVSPDFRFAILGGDSGWISLWNLDKCEILNLIKGHEGFIFSVLLTADGAVGVSGGQDKSIKLWDLATGSLNCILTDNEINEISSLVLSSDGETLISGHRFDDAHRNRTNIVNAWNLSQKSIAKTYSQWGSICSLDVDFSNQKLLTGDHSGNIMLWSMKSEELSIIEQNEERPINSITVSSDGRSAISIAASGKITLYDLAKNRIVSSFESRHFGSTCIMAASKDCRYVLSGSNEDGTLKIWDMAEVIAEHAPHVPAPEIYKIVWDVNRRKVVSQDSKGNICIWSFDSEVESKEILAGTEDYSEVAFNSDIGQIVFANRRSGLAYISLGHEHKAQWIQKAFNSDYVSVDISPDGKYVVSGQFGGDIEVCNTLNGNCIYSLTYDGHPNCSVRYSPDGRFVFAKRGSLFRILDSATGRLITSNLNVQAEAISPDGRLSCSTKGDLLRIYDLITAFPVRAIEDKIQFVHQIKFTPTGRKVVFTTSSIGHGQVYIWDIRKNDIYTCENEQTNIITEFQITPDEKFVISICLDGTVRMWDIHDGRCIQLYYEAEIPRSMSCISPEGKFAIGTEMGNLKILRLNNVTLDTPITTGDRLWHADYDNGSLWDKEISTVCPWCGLRTRTCPKTIETIKSVKHKYGHIKFSNPCIGLPLEVWNEKGLISTCQECGKTIKYNPFIVDTPSDLESLLLEEVEYREIHKNIRKIADRNVWCMKCDTEITTSPVELTSGKSLHIDCAMKMIEDVTQSLGENIEKKQWWCSCCNWLVQDAVVIESIGPLCWFCIKGIYEMFANSINFSKWSDNECLSCFSADSDIATRLAVLWRFEEFKVRISDISEDNRSEIYNHLAKQLGYVNEHPLSPEVRQSALNCCIDMGDVMLPVLIACKEEEPWQFQANRLLVLSSLDPEHQDFKIMLKAAINDEEARIKINALHSIMYYETHWTRSIVESLLFEQDSIVSDRAFDILDLWDINTGIMNAENRANEKDFRSFVLRLCFDPNADIRKQVPRSLVKYKSTWPKKIAEKLAQDANKEVREQAQAAIASWEKE